MDETIGKITVKKLIAKRKAVRKSERIFDTVIAAILLVFLAIGCYAIYDNQQVYDTAGSAQWQAYKPTVETRMTFDELAAVNPEVVAWLDLYGTEVDYPVCQSPTNPMKYLTTDPTGAYTLSGSLFLDAHASKDFTDKATFIFGHHMDASTMFGPIDNFLDKSFLEEHRYGYLFANGRGYGLEMWCAFTTNAYDADVFVHGITDDNEFVSYVDMLRKRARVSRNVEIGRNDRIVLMSTCSSEMTDGRTILVAKLLDDVPANPFTGKQNKGTGVESEDLLFGLPWLFWAALAALGALAALLGGRFLFLFLVARRKALEVDSDLDEHEVYLRNPSSKRGILIDTFSFGEEVIPVGWDKAFDTRKRGKWVTETVEEMGQVTVYLVNERTEERVFADAYRTDGPPEGEWEKVLIPTALGESGIIYRPGKRLVTDQERDNR